MKKLLFILCLSASLFMTGSQTVWAQTDQAESLEGKVVAIENEGTVESNGEKYLYQYLQVEITKGSLTGQTIEVKNGSDNAAAVMAQVETYQVGDKIRISHNQDFEGNDVFEVSGHIKRDSLLLLGLLFVGSVVVVGRMWGVLSIVSMGFSFWVIFQFILPQIMNGNHPVLVVILASVVIVPVTFYISHGFNKKTHLAVISTFIALIITGTLATWFVNLTHLTGFASDEAGFLQVQRQGTINIRSLMLAGIIIGTLGILDDVTVGQVSTVRQLKKANPKMKIKELYQHGMTVGQDHISSMVNTLVLVYAGSSLPLLLLFMDGSRSFTEAMDYELIAEEIVRTLVGSIGLVLIAPIATYLAAVAYASEQIPLDEPDDPHDHHHH